MIGHGCYDDIAQMVLRLTKAKTRVIVIVIDGDRGQGTLFPTEN